MQAHQETWLGVQGVQGEAQGEPGWEGEPKAPQNAPGRGRCGLRGAARAGGLGRGMRRGQHDEGCQGIQSGVIELMLKDNVVGMVSDHHQRGDSREISR